MYIQWKLRIFSGGIAAGELCLPIKSLVEGKNKQIYPSAIPISLDVLDRDF
jgi:hypothetical protein